jgi:hypothetical protein
VWWLTGTSRVPRMALFHPGIAKKEAIEYQLSTKKDLF